MYRSGVRISVRGVAENTGDLLISSASCSARFMQAKWYLDRNQSSQKARTKRRHTSLCIRRKISLACHHHCLDRCRTLSSQQTQSPLLQSNPASCRLHFASHLVFSQRILGLELWTLEVVSSEEGQAEETQQVPSSPPMQPWSSNGCSSCVRFRSSHM